MVLQVGRGSAGDDVHLRHAPRDQPGLPDGPDAQRHVDAGGHLALWSAVAAPPPGLVLTVALGAVGDLVLADRDDLGAADGVGAILRF